VGGRLPHYKSISFVPPVPRSGEQAWSLSKSGRVCQDLIPAGEGRTSDSLSDEYAIAPVCATPMKSGLKCQLPRLLSPTPEQRWDCQKLRYPGHDGLWELPFLLLDGFWFCVPADGQHPESHRMQSSIRCLTQIVKGRTNGSGSPTPSRRRRRSYIVHT